MRMFLLIVEICACGNCFSLPRGLLYFIQKPMVVLPLYDTVVIFHTGMKLFSHQCRNPAELALYYSFQSNNFWWHKFRAKMGTVFSMALVQKSPWNLVNSLYTLHFLAYQIIKDFWANNQYQKYTFQPLKCGFTELLHSPF